MAATRSAEVLSRRALNRALLARQMLLRRWKLTPLKALEKLVGMQAQVPDPPYIGLWTRLQDFQHAELGKLLNSRRAVRISLLRATLHLVSAADCLQLRPLLQTVVQRSLANNIHARELAGLDMPALLATGRQLLERGPAPLTHAELGPLLQRQWPAVDAAALARAMSALPLVQVPPRGLWATPGPAAHTTAEAWLGQALSAAGSLPGLLLRYLAAFGPASVADMQAWSGLNGLAAVVQDLRGQLRSFRDEQGVELLDLPRAPRPAPDIPAPARFLPEYDNILLAHADRRRIISDADRQRVVMRNGIILGTILVDGLVHGSWKIMQEKGRTRLQIQAFRPLNQPQQDELALEGSGLLDFAGAAQPGREIEFLRPVSG